MEIVELKELTHGISTRDHGFEVFQKIMSLLRGIDAHKAVKEHISKHGGEFKSGLIEFDKSKIKTIDVGIKINKSEHPKFSFLDELVYRLNEKDMLKRVMFMLKKEYTIDNLKSISANRKLNINAEIDGEFTLINPTMKVSIEEPEIIYEDL